MSTFPNKPGGALPEKEEGRHRWIAIASYTLTDEEAKGAHVGTDILLDANHLFTPVEVGCLDCEGRYKEVIDQPCPAGDDWSDLEPPPDEPAVDEDALLAAVDLVGRSGGTDFEVGYLHDNVPVEKAAWYAHAQYRGARITAENHPGPVEAAEALARQVLKGAQCTHCKRTVSLGGTGTKVICRWRREGRKWIRGCERTHP